MNTNAFALRLLGPNEIEQTNELKTIDVDSLDQLINTTISNDIRLKKMLNLDKPIAGHEYLLTIHNLSKTNKK